MARLLSTVLFIAWAVQFRIAGGQLMMMPIAFQHPNQQVGHIIRTVAVPVEEQQAADVDYAPNEPIDEVKLQNRIKELGDIRQELADKQLDLQDKLNTLQEQAVNVQSKIAQDQAQIRKLDELERLHYVEQLRLQRLIQSHRLDETRERMHQEQLAQQRAALERSNEKNEPKEPSQATLKQVEYQVNEPSKDTEPVRGISPGGGHKNKRPHPTTQLERTTVQETLVTGIHGISKKENLEPAVTTKVIAVEDKRLAPGDHVISSKHFELLGPRRKASCR